MTTFAVFGAFWLAIVLHMLWEPTADFSNIMTFLQVPIGAEPLRHL